MNKGEYPYPADEFDEVEPVSGPRGVHRTLRSRWSRVWPFLIVIIIFPALAYGAVTYWSGTGAGIGSGSQAGAGTAAATSGATAAQTPSDPPAATPSDPPAATQAPSPTPDLTTPVVVFNSTSRSGLAAEAVKALKAAGWKSATPQNYPGGSLASSTVLFSAADLEASARAAAAVLGITTVGPAKAGAVTGLQIVLESDFKP